MLSLTRIGIAAPLVAALLGRTPTSEPAAALSPEATEAHSIELSAAQWREDLAHLAAEWPVQHRNLYHTMTEAQFREAVRKLDAAIPSLKRYEIIMGIARIAAMINDGHSGIGTLRQEAIDFHRMPLELYSFSDGLFVRRAAGKYSGLAGARVVRIGHTDATVAVDSASLYVATDPGNPGRPRVVAPIFLSMPEVLAALRFSTSLDSVSVTLEKDGRTFDTTVVPVTRTEYDGLRWTDAQKVLAVARRNPSAQYWFEYLPGQRTLYAQLNTMENDTTEGIPVFFHRALQKAERLHAEKFVLDVRDNGGGSSNYVRDIAIDVIKSAQFDRHGHFFVLVGRGTASAAQNLVNELERLTNSVIVGEPTGQGIQFWSDANVFTLPNSHIIAFASTIWFQSFEARDRRPFTTPQIDAELSSRDYATGRDPALDAVVAYRATLPIPLRLLAVAKRAGIQAAGDSLKAFRTDPAYRYRNLSNELIRYTFDRVWTLRNFADGLLMLRTNAIGNPDDWNSHDALAGAFEDSGHLPDAEREYKRALELDPQNKNVQNGLQRVRARLASESGPPARP